MNMKSYRQGSVIWIFRTVIKKKKWRRIPLVKKKL